MEILKIIVSNSAKAIKYILVIVFLCSVIIGCANPTCSDKQALQKLTNNFGDKYTFKLDGEFWLVARAKKGVVIHRGDDEEMFKEFFFERKEEMKERDTSYIYLDWYDADGNFVCQLFFDREKNAFKREKQPYRS
jgi:hypothetical protein